MDGYECFGWIKDEEITPPKAGAAVCGWIRWVLLFGVETGDKVVRAVAGLIRQVRNKSGAEVFEERFNRYLI